MCSFKLDNKHECVPKEQPQSCGPCLYDPSYLLRKLCALIDDDFAKEMIHRHTRILNEYLRLSKDGVLLRDLRYLAQTLGFLLNAIKEHIEYVELLAKLLDLCCIPPLMSQPSDGLYHTEELEELFQTLGYLAISLEEELRLRVLRAIHCQLTREKHANVSSVKLNTSREAAQRSNVAYVVGQLLEGASDRVYAPLMNLAILLASISPKCSADMVTAGAIEFVLLRLGPPCRCECDEPGRGCCSADSGGGGDGGGGGCLGNVESALLWGLLRALQMLGPPPAGYRAPSQAALRNLSKCLQESIFYSDLQSSINILCLNLLCMHIFPDLPIAESGLAEDISILAVSRELGLDETWAKPIMANNSREDFEFKQLLLLSLCFLTDYPAAIKVMEEKQVVPGLMKLVDPGATSAVFNWHPSQVKPLVNTALRALRMLAVVAAPLLVETGSITHILLHLENVSTEKFNEETLSLCLLTLDSIISFSERNFNQDVVDKGTISTVLRFCTIVMRRLNFTFECQNVLTIAFILLQKLCQKNPQEQETHAEAILSTTSLFLDIVKAAHSENSTLIVHDRLILCALDFLWEAVVNSPSNCEKFIKGGNIYKLLDILEMSIFPVQLILLSLLVDLIEFSRCIPYIITWRGSHFKGYLPMLMAIWRQEEIRLAPHRSPLGCISDISLPLMGQEQWLHTYAGNKDPNASPAIVDVYVSARPKIHAIVQLLRHRFRDTVEEIEEFYQMFHNRLSKEDEVTSHLASNYLSLKMGEVWNELVLDLRNTGTKLTDTDAEMMDTLYFKMTLWARHVQQQQEKVEHEIGEQEFKEEKKLYDLLEGSNMQQHILTVRQLEALACSTDYEFMKKLKDIEKSQISVAFPPNVRPEQCHRTYDPTTVSKMIIYEHYDEKYRKNKFLPQKKELFSHLNWKTLDHKMCSYGAVKPCTSLKPTYGDPIQQRELENVKLPYLK